MIKKLSKNLFFSFLMFLFVLGSSDFSQALEPIKLMRPRLNRKGTLMKALKERKSTRTFSKRKIPIEVVSDLLWAAFGINRSDTGKRTAPSAMDKREIDIYVAAESGLYLYNPTKNILEPIMTKDIREFVGEQDFTKDAPICLIYVADFEKMKGGTQDKYFYAAADTGFISQNVYLYCASEGLSTVVVGWVNKSKLAKIMKLGYKQNIILVQPVGYRR